MAFVDIPGQPLVYPFFPGTATGTAVLTRALLIDAAAEKVAWILFAPKAGTLNRVGFRLGTVTQAPANGLTVSFQNVADATGDPDGTQDQTRLVAAGSITSNSWIETGLITSDGTDTGTKRVVTQGERLAIVVEYASFLAGDSLNLISVAEGPWDTQRRNFQYPNHFTAAWSHQSINGLLNIGLQYDDNVWVAIPQCIPAQTAEVVSWGSGSSPNERGMKFTSPVAMRAKGFSWFGGGAANATASLHLYDDADTELATATIPDYDGMAIANGQGGKEIPFSSVANVELKAGATYRVTVKATSATAATHVQGFDNNGTAYNSAMPWGTSAVQTTRTGAGAWTDGDGTLQYAIGLLVDGIQAGAPRARYILGAL